MSRERMRAAIELNDFLDSVLGIGKKALAVLCTATAFICGLMMTVRYEIAQKPLEFTTLALLVFFTGWILGAAMAKSIAKRKTRKDLQSARDEMERLLESETGRIDQLERQHAKELSRLTAELDAKRSENARLMELVESNGLDDAEALRDEVADLKRELMRANASIWNERRKEGAAMKQARGRLSKLTPPEAEAVRELYRHGPAASHRIDESIIEALKDKKAVVGCDGEGGRVRLSDQMVKDLNKHASIFEELFGR